MTRTDGPASETRDREIDSARLDNFLLVEYEHRSEALLRNEDSGDQRATFFVSVAAAAAAVLAFAFGGDRPIVQRDLVPPAAAISAAMLFVFGLLTVRRIIERHIVTDRHIFALRSLRRAFVSREMADAYPNAFFKLYEAREPRKIEILSLGKGGWLQTVALINSILSGIMVAAAVRSFDPASYWVCPALGAFGAFAVVWSGQLAYARRKLAEEVADLVKGEGPFVAR